MNVHKNTQLKIMKQQCLHLERSREGEYSPSRAFVRLLTLSYKGQGKSDNGVSNSSVSRV